MSLLVSSGGVVGPITASDITDSSASGRTVLTGTAAQARTALGVAPSSQTLTLAHNDDAAAHLSIQRRTLTGDLVLTAADLPQQRIIPDVDRSVTLPAEGAIQWLFELCHGGAAYVVTVKRAGGTVVATLVPGAPLVVAWDGVAIGVC